MSLFMSTHTNHMCIQRGSRPETLPDLHHYEVIVTRVEEFALSVTIGLCVSPFYGTHSLSVLSVLFVWVVLNKFHNRNGLCLLFHCYKWFKSFDFFC